MPIELLNNILHVLNNPIKALAKDGKAKLHLLEVVSNLTQAILPSNLQQYTHTLQNFVSQVINVILEAKQFEQE